MVEVACHAQAVEPPVWTFSVAPLAEPWFASELLSARLDLLTLWPPAFRRRNLFVDATIGARVYLPVVESVAGRDPRLRGVFSRSKLLRLTEESRRAAAPSANRVAG